MAKNIATRSDDEEDYIDNGGSGGSDGSGGGGGGARQTLEPLTHAFQAISGVMRSQTASLLEKKLDTQQKSAESLRQLQAREIEKITDPATKRALQIGSLIDRQEIGAIGTTMKLARFDRNSQLIEAGKGAVGLFGDFSQGPNPFSMGGGGGGVALAGAGLGLAYLAGRDTRDEDSDTRQVVMLQPSSTTEIPPIVLG